MASQQEKEESLRRLRLLIITHTTTPEEKQTLEKAQRDLQRKIEVRCQKAVANQQYVFPRQFPASEEPAGFAETVNLKEQAVEQAQIRPKIKLTKSKHDKRAVTEYTTDENTTIGMVSVETSSSKKKPDKAEPFANFKLPLRQTHNSFRLEIRDSSFPAPEARRLPKNNRTALSQLTRSYANLKTHQESTHQSLKTTNLATILKDRSLSQLAHRNGTIQHASLNGKMQHTSLNGRTIPIGNRSREKKGFEFEKSWLKRK